MKRILLAFSFLTILPVPAVAADGGDEKSVGESSAFFPLVGIALGLSAAGILLGLERLFPPPVNGCLIVAGFAFLNGGLHLDGLSDTFDALGSRKSREGRRLIMKDGASGPAGTAAVTLALLLKTLLLAQLFERGGLKSLSLILLPVAGGWSMTAALFHGGSGGPRGLGSLFAEHTKAPQFGIATALASGAFMLAALFSSFSPAEAAVFTTTVMTAVYGGTILLSRSLEKLFGGLTGDTFGAVHEIAGLVYLLSVPAAAALLGR